MVIGADGIIEPIVALKPGGVVKGREDAAGEGIHDLFLVVVNLYAVVVGEGCEIGGIEPGFLVWIGETLPGDDVPGF